MGAYENSMHEEGACEDFAREIKRMADARLAEDDRKALYDMFFACRKIELQNEPGIFDKNGRRISIEPATTIGVTL